jgi:hypothetical protein
MEENTVSKLEARITQLENALAAVNSPPSATPEEIQAYYKVVGLYGTVNTSPQVCSCAWLGVPPWHGGRTTPQFAAQAFYAPYLTYGPFNPLNGFTSLPAPTYAPQPGFSQFGQ